MPVAVNGVDGNQMTTRDVDGSPNNFVWTISKLVFSGTYPGGAAGDTVDLTALAALVPSGSLPINAYAEGNGPVTSQSGAGGYYTFSLGTTLANNKIRIWSAGGTELANAAYPAAVTTDLVTLNICWRKLL